MGKTTAQSHWCPVCGQDWMCGDCMKGTHPSGGGDSLCPLDNQGAHNITDSKYMYDGLGPYSWRWVDDFAAWVTEVRKQHAR